MSLVVVNMEEELPSYSGRIDRLPSYTDIIERYREQLNQHYERNKKMSFAFIWRFNWFI